MSSMWSLVNSVQQTLDEAAGLKSKSRPTTPASTATNVTDEPPAAGNVGMSSSTQMQNNIVVALDQAKQEHVDAFSVKNGGTHGENAAGPAPAATANSNKWGDDDLDLDDDDDWNNESGSDQADEQPSGRSDKEVVGTKEEPSPGREEPVNAEVDAATSDTIEQTPSAAETSNSPSQPSPLKKEANGDEVAATNDATALKAQRKSQSPPAASQPNSATQQRLEEQLMRIQEVLAKETRRADDLETENRTLKRQVETLTAKVASSSSSSQVLEFEAREKALIAEGAELSENLGKERLRSKTILQEKKQLETKINELLTELSDFSAKEQQWQDARTLDHANEEGLKNELRELQTTVQQQSAELSSNADQMERLKSQLNSVKSERTAEHETLVAQSVETLKEKEELIMQLQQEADNATKNLRRTIVECERKSTLAEREASDALERVHVAEAKVMEVLDNAAESTQSLTQQLQESEERFRKLEASRATDEKAAARCKEQVAELQRALRNADNDASTKLTEFMTQQKAVANDLRRAERDRDVVKGKLKQLEKTVEHLTATNADLSQKLAISQSRISAAIPSTVSSAVEKNGTSPPSSPTTASNPGSSAAQGTSQDNLILPSEVDKLEPPQQSPRPAAPQQPTPATTRVEVELAKATVELQELRKMKKEYAVCRKKLTALAKQHDVLLQMYGQQEETVEEHKEQLQESRKAYKSQLVILGETVDSLQKENEMLKVGSGSSTASTPMVGMTPVRGVSHHQLGGGSSSALVSGDDLATTPSRGRQDAL